MRFFKYLIFTSTFLFSTFVYSAEQCTYLYTLEDANKTFSSVSDLCAEAKSLPGWSNLQCVVTGNRISGKLNGGSVGVLGYKNCTEVPGNEPPLECWYPDYKIVQQPISSLKSTICLPINGAMCKYVGDPTGLPVVNGGITTTFSSVSKTPDPSCKEELVNPPCDPKDPYGGCFTPPNDNCTRQFNGSIECPPDIQPPIEKGCNGATYCDRPPQGCGSGYVSGSFNDKKICIKTSPSTGTGGDGTGGDGTGGDGTGGDGTGGDGSGSGDGTGSGSGTGSSTGTGTGTSTSTNTTTNSDGSTTTTTNTTVNNFSIDFSPVVNAVKKVSADIKNLKNELLTSITELTNKLGITNTKIDQTNSKLDDTNTNLTSIKDSSLRQEELLKAIRDKQSPTVGNGSISEQPASGASVDLTETNDILKEIRDFLTGDIEVPEGESVPTGELTERSFSSDLISVNAAYCPADKEINWSTPMGQFNKTVSYRPICDSSSWLGYLFLALAYVFGAMIVVRDT